MSFGYSIGLLALVIGAGLRAADSTPLLEIRVRDPFIFAGAVSKTDLLGNRFPTCLCAPMETTACCSARLPAGSCSYMATLR